MKVVIIDYAEISPAVLAHNLETTIPCSCGWVDIDEDYFEFSVICDPAYIARVERILGQYL